MGERPPPPPHQFNKFYGRPFHDPRFPGRGGHHFLDGHRRPFKFYGGHHGFYLRGPPPPRPDSGGGGGMFRRRWSQDEDEMANNLPDDELEHHDEANQPVHTVVINNGEIFDIIAFLYTVITLY